MTRRVYRYVPFTIEQDPTAEPEYEARCVSGDDVECEACSGTHSRPEPVEEWQRKHTQDTRHRRYRRNFGDYAVLRPPPELVELEETPGSRQPPPLVHLPVDQLATTPRVLPVGRVRVSLVHPSLAVTRPKPCEHHRITQHQGTTYCGDCEQQLYL